MLTMAGSKMATRVAPSLLKAAGADEDLVVSSLEEYEERAVALATDPERLFEVCIASHDDMIRMERKLFLPLPSLFSVLFSVLNDLGHGQQQHDRSIPPRFYCRTDRGLSECWAYFLSTRADFTVSTDEARAQAQDRTSSLRDRVSLRDPRQNLASCSPSPLTPYDVFSFRCSFRWCGVGLSIDSQSVGGEETLVPVV